MVPALICCFCMQNCDFWITIRSLYGSQTSPVDLWIQKSVLRSRMTIVYWSQPSSVVLCIQNSIRITSLYGSQPSSVVLWIHNRNIMTRINNLYGSQTSHVVLCMKNSVISARITSLHGSQTSPVVCACKTTWLSSEFLVSMGPSPHLWFLHAKLRLLDHNYKSLWVPDLACWFVNQKPRV